MLNSGFKNLADEAILAELGHRTARLRLARNLTQAQLAREAGVSARTLARFERGASTQLTNLVRILRALDLLESLGALIPDQDQSPLNLLDGAPLRRRRASSESRSEVAEERPWTWSDDDEGSPS